MPVARSPRASARRRFMIIFLEQLANRERWPLGAVRHHGNEREVGAINFDADPCERILSRRALQTSRSTLPLLAALPDWTSLPLAATSSEASPVLCSRHTRRVLDCLIGAATKGDDIVFMKDDIRLPSLDSRELSGGRRRFAAQHVDRAGQLGKLEFKRADLSQLRLDLIQQFVAPIRERPTEGLDEVFTLDVELAL